MLSDHRHNVYEKVKQNSRDILYTLSKMYRAKEVGEGINDI